MDSGVAAALNYITETGWKPGDPAPSTGNAIEDRIRKDYPAIAWMLDLGDESLRELMLESFDPIRGFNEAQFRSKLYNTEFWQTHSASEREYLTAKHEDPAELESTLRERTHSLDDWIRTTFGHHTVDAWDREDTWKYAEIGVRLGLSDNQLTDLVLLEYMKKGTKFQFEGGQGAALYNGVKATANDYMLKLDHKAALDHTYALLAGAETQESLAGTFMEQARQKLPHLDKYFDMGITPGQFFEPHRQQIAELLELPEGAAGVDLVNDDRFQSVVQFDDNGEIRPMTVNETGRFVRGLEDWQYTSNAHEGASAMAEELMQTFGAVKR